MPDKLVERDMIAARKLADDLEEVYLDLAVSTLNEQLPFFLELMEKYKLNPLNQEHLKYVRESLEARLNAGADSPKKEELKIISPGRPLEMMPEIDFESSFIKECERVKDEFLIIYNEYAKLNINDFTNHLFLGRDDYCYIELKLENKVLTARYADKREKNIEVWGTESCWHAFLDIKTNDGINFLGKSCSHISDNLWANYFVAAKECYRFYFEKCREIPSVERFNTYFQMFRELPDEINRFANPRIRKEIDEKNTELLTRARENLKNSLLKA